MKKRKSISHWWSILTGNYGRLWKSNLLYLLCVAPGAICGFLFFLFHAYLFLILGVIGLILADPGILAMHRAALDGALDTPQTDRASFPSLYRKYFRSGCIAGLILAVGMLLIGMPIYFALSIQNPLFPALLCLGGMWLVLWLSSSSQVCYLLSTADNFPFSQLLPSVFAPGAVGIVLGLVKLAWVCLCLFVPAVAAALAILGLPTILRFSIFYYLYNQGDENE